MEQKEINAGKDFDEQMAKCASVCQKYIAHVFNKQINELFDIIYHTQKSKIKQGKHKVFKFRLSLNKSDHLFDLNVHNSKILREEMSKQINAIISTIYTVVKATVKFDTLSIEERTWLADSVLVIDPQTTSLIMVSMKHMEWSTHVRDNIKKRISFRWN